MNNLYYEIRQEYLAGHLSLTEADGRLARLELDADQAAEWLLMRKLDSALQQRGEDAGYLPWLELGVTNRIDSLQKAREWLKSQSGRSGRHRQAGISVSPMAVRVTGAGLLGAVTGYIAAAYSPALESALSGFAQVGPVTFSFTLLCALAGVFAVLSPSLLKYYR